MRKQGLLAMVTFAEMPGVQGGRTRWRCDVQSRRGQDLHVHGKAEGGWGWICHSRVSKPSARFLFELEVTDVGPKTRSGLRQTMVLKVRLGKDGKHRLVRRGEEGLSLGLHFEP